jgi:sugar/nucleoside kinase (ribokinase family)
MFKFNERIQLPDKPNDILTVGELLVDMISEEYDEIHASNTYKIFFGGSPANIAMNVKKLGIRSLVASAVGKDGIGTFLIDHLHRAEIDTKLVQRVDYSTSMVVVTKSTSTPIPIFYRGADCHIQYTPMIEEALLNSNIFHFSCWPISITPARYTIERLIEKAKENNILVCFDPNYHPMIWQKGEDGIDYVKSIISRVDVVKPSEDDAERLFGKDTPENQLKKFIDLGAKLVIMTLGKEGAIVSNGIETVALPTLAFEVVDTTGAGDAFWSGFYTGLVKGHTLRESLILGAAVSAYKLKFIGAVVDLPSSEQIKRLYQL